MVDVEVATLYCYIINEIEAHAAHKSHKSQTNHGTALPVTCIFHRCLRSLRTWPSLLLSDL